jgi:hypothetical protein
MIYNVGVGYAFAFVLWGGFLVIEYSLLVGAELALKAEIESNHMVSVWFGFARAGLALLIVSGCLVHGILGTYKVMAQEFRHLGVHHTATTISGVLQPSSNGSHPAARCLAFCPVSFLSSRLMRRRYIDSPAVVRQTGDRDDGRSEVRA